ncbi:uncharacterized protein SEPMUDRAFT_72990 [Sphaerulina musiva SO2202]|uniref:Ribosomal protein bL31m N-terminal domain-containing protein n=1 Tax=Sphaerulina musiva (strain SO2202) TaxID=692275 RepID=M3CXH9_SPHMS|nr:uncharacterized protein SEPMUDRAFT_72990 [Sphaerulina musiva SO2202]EMF08812.1 hypothetical protein SEPMUDRAFT_72990 [Sphaerulina musiva SO2202]
MLTTRPVCFSCALAAIRTQISHQQVRHATLLRRPKRPYTFTQLITLSDGSTFLHRTTSPAPVYRSAKDTKNTAMWNPSNQKFVNIEEDEAGRLKRFRKRFGRGYDAESMGDGEAALEGQETLAREGEDENLLDLIGGYNKEAEKKGNVASVKEDTKRSGKEKGGQK